MPLLILNKSKSEPTKIFVKFAKFEILYVFNLTGIRLHRKIELNT